MKRPVPALIRTTSNRHCQLITLRDDDLPFDAEEGHRRRGFAECRPFLTIAVGDHPCHGRRRKRDDVHIVLVPALRERIERAAIVRQRGSST
jgi:hypothetical protein